MIPNCTIFSYPVSSYKNYRNSAYQNSRRHLLPQQVFPLYRYHLLCSVPQIEKKKDTRSLSKKTKQEPIQTSEQQLSFPFLLQYFFSCPSIHQNTKTKHLLKSLWTSQSLINGKEIEYLPEINTPDRDAIPFTKWGLLN